MKIYKLYNNNRAYLINIINKKLNRKKISLFRNNIINYVCF